MKHLALLLLLFCGTACSSPNPSTNPSTTLSVEKIIVDSTDQDYGYYLAVEPKGEVEGVLVLLPGFGQGTESIFTDTEFHNLAHEKNILTVGFAGRVRLTADSFLRKKLNLVLGHLMAERKIDKDRFVLGGFSAGGVIALRYTELCHQYPEEYPILPRGVFLADAPVDLYHSWKLQEENLANNASETSVNEAQWISRFYRELYGATPSEDPAIFTDLSPFSINKVYGENEKYLADVAIRTYHDIDVSWRLTERNQSPKYDNFISSAELINRLRLMGHTQAEFIQTFQTGYRTNGDRHPHSWSIVDEEECLEWIQQLLLPSASSNE